MPESPKEKTTRKIVEALEEHQFCFYATVYLNAEDGEINKRTIDRAKRLITLDNPEQLIFYFISRNIVRDVGEMPYISFYSHEQLVGTRLIDERAKNPDYFNLSGGKRKKYISTAIPEVRYEGKIRKLKEGKVFKLSSVHLPEKFNRFGFLNK